MTSDPIRVLVVDDHPIVRSGLIALISTLEGIEVVAEAGDGAAAIREATLTRPDVAVVDLRMPGVDGIEVARRITPGVAVLVLTMFDEDELIADVLAAGALGVLLKGAEAAEIERAIRAVASGSAIFAPELAPRVVGGTLTRRSTTPAPDLPITSREREVLDLVARGVSNATIATELGMAGKTVGNHISSIFLKLGVSTRAEAIVLAREIGFGA